MDRCNRSLRKYRSKIEDIVRIQVKEGREAIFFIYADGSTSEIIKGDNTSISLSSEEEKRLRSNGKIVSSVHSHPSGFDPSTIDIMTGIMTKQNYMCVVTPAMTPDEKDDFVLTCVEMDQMSDVESQRLLRAMRRSSVGVTDVGRMLRKYGNLTRFNINGCRSQQIR